MSSVSQMDTELAIKFEASMAKLETGLNSILPTYFDKFKFNTEVWGIGFERVASPDYVKAFHKHISSHFGGNLHSRMALPADVGKHLNECELFAVKTISDDILPVTEEWSRYPRPHPPIHS